MTARAKDVSSRRPVKIRILSRFRKDAKAVAAVEFAIISVPFLAVLMAMFETAFVLFNAEMLDATTANVSRQLMTGQIQQSSGTCALQKQAFQNMICPLTGTRPASALPSNFDCSKVIIDVRQASFDSADVTNALYQNPGSAQFSPAPAGGNNVIRVIYPLPAIMPVLSGYSPTEIAVNRAGQVQYNGMWTRILMGVSVFKTEPYGTGGGGTC